MNDLASSLYPGLLADLIDGSLLQLEAGERLWKLYFLRPAWGREDRMEHRIYTKEQPDGLVTLVSYNFKMPPGSRPSKSNIVVARDIPKDTLNQLIWTVVRKSEIGPDELEVVDLSGLATFETQVNHLRSLETDPAGVEP